MLDESRVFDGGGGREIKRLRKEETNSIIKKSCYTVSNPASQLRSAAQTSPRAFFGLCTSGKAFYPPSQMTQVTERNARIVSLRLGQFTPEGKVRVSGSLRMAAGTQSGFDLCISGDKLVRFFLMIGWDDSRNSKDFSVLNQTGLDLDKLVRVKFKDDAFYDIGHIIEDTWLLYPEEESD